MPRKSAKPEVIEWIFLHRKYDVATATLTDPVVTMDDINEAIRITGAKLKLDGNRANFWKDITRGGDASLNRYWPPAVFALGFVGADAIGYGEGAVFMFVPVPAGQAVAYVSGIVFNSQLPVIKLQSLSMPQAMKELGRPGETWHAQVADRLNVVSSFFALCSPRNVPPRNVHEVNFLQTNIKLGKGESDAAFSLLADDGQWLVSAEVKGRTEQFHLPQIARAVYELEQAVRASSATMNISGVIPLGIKVVDKSVIWVVEFAPVATRNAPLVKVAEGVFELVPHVPGVE
ncbi:hypothetical protein [Microbacterium sp.]|uniref:hypothetical protein n=1 Tax=Microbacterium sp. TaxID=51671 RepID=UPI0033412ED3